jgi:septal ring factor EnvC (AmiA/AmiB activator)
MELSTGISLGALVITLLGGILAWAREEAVLKKVSEYQSAELKQYYMEFLDLRKKFEDDKEKRNETNTQIAIANRDISSIQEDILEIKPLLRELFSVVTELKYSIVKDKKDERNTRA